MSSRTKLIVVLGPTATGKSALGVFLAKKFNGEIISADSRQVYRGLDLGSGKITKSEMQGVPHRLLDVAAPRARFTLQQYKKQVEKAIQQIARRGHLPIMVGGSALYIYAVLENWQLPKVKPNLTLRAKLEAKSCAQLYKLLQKRDPQRAKLIDRHNKRRLVRALEIIVQFGQVPKLIKNSPYRCLKLGLNIKPVRLKPLIAQRLAKRLKLGMLAEVKRLHKQGLSWSRLEGFGLEYKYCALYLQGKITKIQLIAGIERASWQLVKQQLTWFKKDRQIHWLRNKKQALQLAREFLLH